MSKLAACQNGITSIIQRWSRQEIQRSKKVEDKVSDIKVGCGRNICRRIGMEFVCGESCYIPYHSRLKGGNTSGQFHGANLILTLSLVK
jgi:hypothetical protein